MGWETWKGFGTSVAADQGFRSSEFRVECRGVLGLKGCCVQRFSGVCKKSLRTIQKFRNAGFQATSTGGHM